jgi:hypothetical protein
MANVKNLATAEDKFKQLSIIHDVYIVLGRLTPFS